MKHVVTCSIWVLAFSLLMLMPLDQASAFGGGSGGGDGGCCVSDSIIASMGESYGVGEIVTLDMMDRLSKETFADLRLLQSTPAEACAAYRVCDEVPDEFFRVLLGETIERFKAAELKASQRQAFIFTLLTACVAGAGLLLSIFNTWQTRRRPKTE